ncbi:MAG: glucoamylase family protein, partial [Pseudomonadota bacterium]
MVVPKPGSDDKAPLRAALFSAAQMEQHGASLAAHHVLSHGRGRDTLLARLADNEEVIARACSVLTAAVKSKQEITPAAEWLLDNYYLIEEQIRTAKRHLPKDYSKELPRLASGASAGQPRVYDIALEIISHGDGRVDPESLSRFMVAYQQVTPLKLGELWAIPIMLRLALIENLRRVAAHLIEGRSQCDLACNWADAMTETAEHSPGNLILLVADMARSSPPMESTFVAELARRLQGRSPALTLPLTWMSHHLFESGQTVEQLVQSEIGQQAAEQVSISNSIGSLRLLGITDWREFVETQSAVEHTLCQSPDGNYLNMDFATRDQYRHAVEKIARCSHLSESEVATKALQLAALGEANEPTDWRKSHIGFYLIGGGRQMLERAVDAHSSPWVAFQTKCRNAPLGNYLGAIFGLTAIFSAALTAKAYADHVDYGLLAALTLLLLLGTSQLAVSLVNWLSTLLVMPRALPRLDYSSGIPDSASTLVVVPTMLFTEDNVDALCEAQEVRFLANRDANLCFCLLTDFGDAASETMPGDAILLARIQHRLEEMNAKYRSDGRDYFMLMHRPRRWNPQEKIWMGYERKRGKLADLNSLLRSGLRDMFAHTVSVPDDLSFIRYVITLDTDTQLPRDAARQLVATMAHPLNRARYDERLQRICDGYGILQPRAAVSLPGAHASRYERLFAGESGIDPYTRAISDVYQDIFEEGSFVGKGIYDVDAFERVMNGRFPENQILSHDLLEGCYARSGLLSDVLLYEEYPSRYSADVSRRHRWIRGDWQLLGWLLPSVPGASTRQSGTRLKNPLSALSRWKLFDNLRRSLVPTALLSLLLLGWLVLPAPWLWTAAVLAILALPTLCILLVDLLRKGQDVRLRQHLRATLRDSGIHFSHVLLGLTFLAYETYFSLDAIVRTLWRMGVSHKLMLEWNPSHQSKRASNLTFAGAYSAMWVSPLLAIATAFGLMWLRPEALVVAAPVLLLWLVAPAVARWISLPQLRRLVPLIAGQPLYLRRLARKTWGFFETYVGAEDHWLPPDNMQEYPVAVVAHRTSPTNIGLSLLANLTAYDFGYIPVGQMLTRCDNTLQTMAQLARHEGHFYNWYDTLTLQPLHPIYISTVDSGNLAGHLLTLRPGLLGLVDQPILNPQQFQGIRDTFLILADVARETSLAPLAQCKALLESACDNAPSNLKDACSVLAQLRLSTSAFAAQLKPSSEPLVTWWSTELSRQCSTAYEELVSLAPWCALSQSSDWNIGAFNLDLQSIPTLRSLAALEQRVLQAMEQHPAPDDPQSGYTSLSDMIRLVFEGSRVAGARIAHIERLAAQAEQFAQMEYAFLFDQATKLLSIGYNLSERRLDSGAYDLLASEARLCSFVAIAQGKIPKENWFALGRQQTDAGGGDPVLLSWSGSMFEYLMPLVVMPTFDNTLLDQTYHACVERQIAYGKQCDVPWGVSESGYNGFDARLNYQYRAFGVPGLGLKRGLGDDLVIAPYASMMALMVAPEAACLNLQRLSQEGFEGKFGMFEAIDYSASRLPRGQDNAVIRSFMAHHQGMGLLSLSYLLLNRPMQARFNADPLFQATMLLLQERIPRATAIYTNTAELTEIRTASNEHEMPMRVINRADTRIPEVQLLSNGRYHVMVTNAGGSYSRWHDLALTRWREDSTCDHWGTFCYVRDLEDGSYWSTAFQPTQTVASSYEVIFSEGRAEFRRHDNEIEMHTEIVVSPEDDIELRRTRITNRSGETRRIEVTSYAEVVLATPAADAAHPAFSNLFVQTEIIRDHHGILCTRRPRSLGDKMPWMFHLMAVHGAAFEQVSYETDRMQFIGRGNSVATPLAMQRSGRLSDSAGSVLDPIIAIRYQITLEPEQSAVVDIVTGVADERDQALHLIEKYQDRHLADRVFELAWTHSQVVLRQLNASETDAQLYGRLANSIIYANPSLRADAAVLIKNHRGQSGLWSYAISGDLPIVLVQISDMVNFELVRQLVQAHAYWRAKGLAVDLVIWNEDHAGYRQVLQEQIIGLIASGSEAQTIDRPGG